MADIAQRIREIRKRDGLTQAEFAKATGIAQSSISKWESGKEEPSFSNLLKIADFAGESALALLNPEDHNLTRPDWPGPTDIVGGIQANYFCETPFWGKNEIISVQLPLSRPLSRLSLKGFLIKDQSASEVFGEGSVVFALNIDEYKINLGPGDLVVVQRAIKNGLKDLTIWRYRVFRGDVWLWPISNDPHFHQPANFKTDMGDGIVAIKVVGLIVGSFQLHQPPARFETLAEEAQTF